MRRCSTVPGFGACCRAAQQGRLNQYIPISTQHGTRCGICRPHTKRNGSQGFEFRFAKGTNCGLVSGCPVGQAGGGGVLQIPQF